MIKASKIFHRDEHRILLEFPYNTEMVEKIKTIFGATWSKTFNGWHVAYTKEVFGKLKELFPGIDYPGKSEEPIKAELPIINDIKEDNQKARKTDIQNFQKSF